MHIFGRQIESAHVMGVKRITAEAWRDETDLDEHGKEKCSGYYVWPLYGYDGRLPKSIRASLSRSSLPSELKRASRISQLMAHPSGRKWWSKHGEKLDVHFNLDGGSSNLRDLDSVLQQKLPGLK